MLNRGVPHYKRNATNFVAHNVRIFRSGFKIAEQNGDDKKKWTPLQWVMSRLRFQD